MTLVAARFQDTFTAARVFQGGCKSGDFNDWLAEELCPRLTSNHVLILDNASLHKTPRTRELIESSGASLMFLPPYPIPNEDSPPISDIMRNPHEPKPAGYLQRLLAEVDAIIARDTA